MKTAIVLGGAPSIWEDYDEATLRCGIKDAHVIVVNDIGVYWKERVRIWASIHGEKLVGSNGWVAARRFNDHNFPEKLYTGKSAAQDQPAITNFPSMNVVDVMFPGQSVSGSSGLFACKVALEHEDYKRVILCGIPMDDAGHFDKPLTPWPDGIASRQGWLQALPHLKGRVFSTSGWTKELLGGPP